ncbi:MAG: hypothetical protein ACE5IJ_09265 [Thermoplasmata archaeon]
MKIESFRVTSVDDFGGRVSEVRTSRNRFETPTRVATSTEYNYKKNLGIEVPFENDVGEYVARFNQGDIQAFTTRNGSYANRIRTATAYANQMRFVVSKCYPQYPYAYPFDERTIRLILDVQLESGLDMVSIPHSVQEESRLTDHFRRWARYVEEYGERFGEVGIPVPHVPMRLEEELFQDTLRELWDDRSTFPVVGLTYAPIHLYKINFDFLRNNRDQETWLHISQVPRAKYRGTNPNVSVMHWPQIYGIDTVATMIPWGGGGTEPPANYGFIRYFDHPTLSVPKIGAWIDDHKTTETQCPCPICRDRSFPEITDEFVAQRREEVDYSPLFGVFRLHEVFRSSDAFNEGRVVISENDFRRYMRDRIGSAIEEFHPA